jgi:hypothetical protein
MPDAGCQMPDAGCQMPDAGFKMLDARYQPKSTNKIEPNKRSIAIPTLSGFRKISQWPQGRHEGHNEIFQSFQFLKTCPSKNLCGHRVSFVFFVELP